MLPTTDATELIQEFDNSSFSNETMKKMASSSLTKLTFIISVCLFGLVVNSIICYSIFKKKTLHLPTYILICNMCISDMITLIGVAINGVLESILTTEGINLCVLCFNISCKLFLYLLSTSFAVSTFSLATIAVDRYCIATQTRMKQSVSLQTKWKLRITITSLWLGSFIINSPLLRIIHLSPQFPYQCDFFHQDSLYNIMYFSSFFIITYFLPLAIVIIMYFKLGIFLRSALIRRSRIHPNGSNRKFLVNQKRRLSMIKMMTAATVAYMLISVPFVVIVLTSTYLGTSLSLISKTSSVGSILISAGFTLSSFSCIVNPIIYLIFNDALRKALPLWLRCHHSYKKIRVSPIR